jgi:hypothetical protein
MVHSFVQATSVIAKPGTSKQVGQWLSRWLAYSSYHISYRIIARVHHFNHIN